MPKQKLDHHVVDMSYKMVLPKHKMPSCRATGASTSSSILIILCNMLKSSLSYIVTDVNWCNQVQIILVASRVDYV